MSEGEWKKPESPNEPVAVCFDGTHMWVANSSNNNVTKLKASDGSLVGVYNTGFSPQCICFDGTNIWVTNWASGNVTELRGSDGRLAGVYSLVHCHGRRFWTGKVNPR